jgi:Tfp pilus assembly PilM family ATPase
MTMRRLRAESAKALRLPTAAIGRLLAEQGMLRGDSELLADVIAGALDGFIEEIAQSAAYASTRYDGASIERVYLVGIGASIPGLAEHLSSALECEFIAPHLSELATIRQPLAERPLPGEGIASLGLARWQAENAA